MPGSQALDMNLLPDAYRQKRAPLWLPMLAVLLALLLLGLVPLFRNLTQAQAAVATAQTDVRAALKAVPSGEDDLALLEELQRQIAAAENRRRLLEGETQLLGQTRPRYMPSLSTAVAAQQPGTTLHGMGLVGPKLTLQGRALSQALVLDYARALQATGYYSTVQITEMLEEDAGNLPMVKFVIVAEQR